MINIKKVEKSIAELEQTLLKHKKQVILYCGLVALLITIVFGLINSPDYVLTISYSLVIIYFFVLGFLLALKNKVLTYRFLVASLIAFLWMIFARDQYGYNHSFLTLVGINLFPAFAWALGLFGVHTLYAYLKHKLKIKKLWAKFIFFYFIYFVVLIFFETYGYHSLNIHNITSATYDGLPLCDCMHAPTWMQIMYFSLGPILYWLYIVLRLDEVKNQKLWRFLISTK